MRELQQSKRLQHVRYDVRGPILLEAEALEATGAEVLRLNVGNPAAFGFEAPQELLDALTGRLADATGYSDSQGVLEPREHVAEHYRERGIAVDPDDVHLGNGVSELIMLVLQALLDPGDEVLIPAPDYPLWTGAVKLCGGVAVHYACAEEADWNPDLEEIEARITSRTRALVLINPNNPTGAVYSHATVAGFAEIARRHSLLLLSDEIYDQILYDGAVHHHAARFAGDDVVCVTFSGLSKTYRLAGFRSGWMTITGARPKASSFLEGLRLLSNMRMCANVPAQYVISAALGGERSIEDLVLPKGRLLAQRDVAYERLNAIPGVSCVKPLGALYCFPRLDPAVYPILDDEHFAIDVLRATHTLVTHGTGFNWPRPDHFRLVTLPPVDVLASAIDGIGAFLAGLRAQAA